MNPWYDGPAMYEPRMDAVVNRWFTTYEAARHFLVTDVAGVIELGLDPADPDWECIGRNWVQPGDRAA